MKNSIKVLLIAALYFVSMHVKAQQLPVNIGYSGTVNGSMPYPVSFNQDGNFPSNSSNNLLYNYTRVYKPTEPMTSVPSFYSLSSSAKVHVTTTYQGGWYDPLMTINSNGALFDIVQPYDYRVSDTTTSYLPYKGIPHSQFQMSAFTSQMSYYYYRYPQEEYHAYSKSISSTSGYIPTLKAYTPGKMMVGMSNGVTTTTGAGYTGEVFNLKLNGTTIEKLGTYSSQETIFEKNVNAHGETSISYKDKGGRLLCTKVYIGGSEGINGWLCTYYVYDEFGRLCVTIPPKEAIVLSSSSSIDALSGRCFTSFYNEHGDIVKTYTPGKSVAGDFTVYSKSHQPVMTQNALQRDSAEKWSFLIYDKLGRPVVTGVSRSLKNREYWQGIMAGTHAPDVGSTPQEYTLEYWLVHGCSGYDYPDSIKDAVIHTYNYYDSYQNYVMDNYSFAYSSSHNSGMFPATNGNEAPVQIRLVHGKLTSTRTRLLGAGQNHDFLTDWVNSAYFYDEKGRIIQKQSNSPYGGVDVEVTQYHFTGVPVYTMNSVHACSTCDVPIVKTQITYNYHPKTRQLLAVSQKLNNETNWKILSTYFYDDLGRISSKKLGEVEIQNYSYNIRGQLIGINADSLNRIAGSGTRSYCSSISYENGFTNRRLDGKMSGYRWRAAGEQNVKAYGYAYDAAGRLISADYRDSSSASTWNNSARDFTVSDLTYDANGNILTMKQRGYNNAMQPADMDVLSYSYNSAEQLQKVTDAGVSSPIHDFVNTNGTDNDYSYDVNGNLTADANKGITAMYYNHMGQPKGIVTNTGTISNLYSAGGALMQKTIDEGGNVNVYKYVGAAVYRNDSLQYVMHPEGRSRWLADSNRFEHDFFIKDHLGNIRATVTTYDEVHTSHPVVYEAGFEVGVAQEEEFFFDNIGVVRDNNPAGTPTDLHSAHLHGAIEEKRIAASLMLHGMAGDRLKVEGMGYYEDTSSEHMNTYATGESMFNSLFSVLNNNIVPGAWGGGEDDPGAVYEALGAMMNPSAFDLYNSLKDSLTDPAYPRAYLNVLFFDEEFNLRTEYCQAIQLKGPPNEWNHMATEEIEMPGNGYILTYWAAESDMDIYYESVTTIVTKGERGQEQHYYPHGLAIDAGTNPMGLKTKYLYQGKQLQEELGLELHDFHARQYDAQLGRFWAVDPMGQFASSYTGMANDPANMVDPDGMYALANGGGGGLPRELSWEPGIIDLIMGSTGGPGGGFGGSGAHGGGGGYTGTVTTYLTVNGAYVAEIGSVTYLGGVPAGVSASPNNAGVQLTFNSSKNSYGFYIKSGEWVDRVEYSGEMKQTNKGTDGVMSGVYDGYYNVISKWHSISTSNRGRSGMEKAGLIFGATDVSMGSTGEIINYGAKTSKSLEKFSHGLKVAGKFSFALQSGVSLYTAGNALYNNDANKFGVLSKAGLDMTIGAISVWGGPIGWGVGGVYFIGDAAGWWGNWGSPTGK